MAESKILDKDKEVAYSLSTDECDDSAASTVVMEVQEESSEILQAANKMAGKETTEEMEVDGGDPKLISAEKSDIQDSSAQQQIQDSSAQQQVPDSSVQQQHSASGPSYSLSDEQNIILNRIGYPTNKDGTSMSDDDLRGLSPNMRRDLFEVMESLIVGRRKELSKICIAMDLAKTDECKDDLHAEYTVVNGSLVTLFGNMNHLASIFEVQLPERIAQTFDPRRPPLPAQDPYRPESPMDVGRAGNDGTVNGRKIDFNPVRSTGASRGMTRTDCWNETMERAALLRDNWTTGAGGALGPLKPEEKEVSSQVDEDYPRRGKHYLDMISQRRDEWWKTAEAEGKIRPKTILKDDSTELSWNEYPDDVGQEEVMGKPMRDFSKLLLSMLTHVYYEKDPNSKIWYTEHSFSSDTLLLIEAIWRPGQRCPYLVCRHEDFNMQYGIEVFHSRNMFMQHLCEMHAPATWYYECPIKGGGCKVRLDRLSHMVCHIKHSPHKRGEVIARRMLEDLPSYTERNAMYSKGHWLSKHDHYVIGVLSGRIKVNRDGTSVRKIPMPTTWDNYDLPTFPTAGAIFGKNLDQYGARERVVLPTPGSSEFLTRPMSAGVKARREASSSAQDAQCNSDISDGGMSSAQRSPERTDGYVLRDAHDVIKMKCIPAGAESKPRECADDVIDDIMITDQNQNEVPKDSVNSSPDDKIVATSKSDDKIVSKSEILHMEDSIKRAMDDARRESQEVVKSCQKKCRELVKIHMDELDSVLNDECAAFDSAHQDIIRPLGQYIDRLPDIRRMDLLESEIKRLSIENQKLRSENAKMRGDVSSFRSELRTLRDTRSRHGSGDKRRHDEGYRSSKDARPDRSEQGDGRYVERPKYSDVRVRDGTKFSQDVPVVTPVILKQQGQDTLQTVLSSVPSGTMSDVQFNKLKSTLSDVMGSEISKLSSSPVPLGSLSPSPDVPAQVGAEISQFAALIARDVVNADRPATPTVKKSRQGLSPRGRGSPKGGRLEASVQRMHLRQSPPTISNPVASPQPSTCQADSMMGVMGAAPSPGSYPRGVVQLLQGEVVSRTVKSLSEIREYKDNRRAYQARDVREESASGRESRERGSHDERRSRHSSRNRDDRHSSCSRDERHRHESDRSCSTYSGYSRDNSLEREREDRRRQKRFEDEQEERYGRDYY